MRKEERKTRQEALQELDFWKMELQNWCNASGFSVTMHEDKHYPVKVKKHMFSPEAEVIESLDTPMFATK